MEPNAVGSHWGPSFISSPAYHGAERFTRSPGSYRPRHCLQPTLGPPCQDVATGSNGLAEARLDTQSSKIPAGHQLCRRHGIPHCLRSHLYSTGSNRMGPTLESTRGRKNDPIIPRLDQLFPGEHPELRKHRCSAQPTPSQGIPIQWRRHAG